MSEAPQSTAEKLRVAFEEGDEDLLASLLDPAVRWGGEEETADHARADSYVSLAVVASALVVSLGLPIADPLIGLGITAVILKITWDSWRTVRGHRSPAARLAELEQRG